MASREHTSTQFRLDAQHMTSELVRDRIHSVIGHAVTVDIEFERVILRGSVDSWHEKQRIQEAAGIHAGECVVLNELAVGE